MTFIEAVIAISRNPNFRLCDDETELLGTRSCICVYRNGEFVGKLRWPTKNQEAEVDESLVKELNKNGL